MNRRASELTIHEIHVRNRMQRQAMPKPFQIDLNDPYKQQPTLPVFPLAAVQASMPCPKLFPHLEIFFQTRTAVRDSPTQMLCPDISARTVRAGAPFHGPFFAAGKRSLNL